MHKEQLYQRVELLLHFKVYLVGHALHKFKTLWRISNQVLSTRELFRDEFYAQRTDRSRKQRLVGPT